MKIKTEFSESEYQNNLKFLSDHITLKGALVDTEFNVVQKWGFKWVLLSLCQPFYAAFGKDIFCHVRLQSVSKNIFEYFEVNQKFASDLTKQMEKALFDKLIAKSSKHKTELEKLQKNIPFLHLCKWPETPDQVGLTAAEQLQIDRSIRAVLSHPDYELRVTKPAKKQRIWTLFKEGQDDIVHRLPRTVYKIGEVWVFNTKVLIAKGGQRKVKGAYSLSKGKALVKKKYDGAERVVFDFFSNNKLSCIVNIRHVLQNPKPIVLEEFYEGTLVNLFETQAFKELPTKIALISDLLLGLVNLYKIPLNIESKPFPFSHRDLSLSNILIDKDDSGQHHAVIGDVATLPGIAIKKTGWVPPEFLKFAPFPDVVEFNREFGRSIDIWQIGLLMSIIMTGQTLNMGVTPTWTALPKIAAAIKNGYNQSLEPKDILIKDLSQNDIDEDIQAAKDYCLKAHLNKSILRMHPGLHSDAIIVIWDLIRDCLRIEPKHRISAEKALQVFQEICRRIPLI